MSAEPLRRIIRRIEPLDESATVHQAASRIATAGCGLPVVDARGDLVGLVDELELLAAVTPGYLRDLHGTDLFAGDPSALRRHVARVAETPVLPHVRRDVAVVEDDDAEMNAAARLLQSGQHTLPVVAAGTRRVVGVLRLSDIIGDLVEDLDRP